MSQKTSLVYIVAPQDSKKMKVDIKCQHRQLTCRFMLLHPVSDVLANDYHKVSQS